MTTYVMYSQSLPLTTIFLPSGLAVVVAIMARRRTDRMVTLMVVVGAVVVVMVVSVLGY